MAKVCQRHAKDMPNICQRYAKDMTTEKEVYPQTDTQMNHGSEYNETLNWTRFILCKAISFITLDLGLMFQGCSSITTGFYFYRNADYIILH